MLERLFPIVEGHGEVEAVPVLLRRLVSHRGVTVAPAFRLPRTKMTDCQEFRSAIAYGALKAGPAGGVLVILDADDDPACRIGPMLLDIARTMARDCPVGLVAAEREFEAWLLASALSLRGHRRVRDDAVPPANPEAIRDAKGYLSANILLPDKPYAPTVDQAALTSWLDPSLARSCSSFLKLERDVERLLASR
ncbi:MAG: DUF4276 family protein [Alphaproteobacteria bacterium]|nr:DUF4276 family protein [Alphaproteobacteria bacterium]